MIKLFTLVLAFAASLPVFAADRWQPLALYGVTCVRGLQAEYDPSNLVTVQTPKLTILMNGVVILTTNLNVEKKLVACQVLKESGEAKAMLNLDTGDMEPMGGFFSRIKNCRSADPTAKRHRPRF